MKLAALIKKEFFRFFRDPKLIATMILPGILIFFLYSLMGDLLWSEEQKYDFKTVYVGGESAIIQPLLQQAAVQLTGQEDWTLTPAEDVEQAKEAVREEKATALILFDENFDERILSYSPESGERAPQVRIYYCSADETSAAFYSLAISVLDAYESTVSNMFDVNLSDEVFDFSSEADVLVSLLGGFLPFLIVALIFSSCMSITLESVAGEKERGTLATVLVTSVRRSDIALGKVIPLSCISVIGALSSFLGVIFSFPKLMGISVSGMAGAFGISSYLQLLLSVCSVVPFIVALLTLVSAYSKSVKEASAYSGVVMIFVMVLSLAAGIVDMNGLWVAFVPVLGTVSCISRIMDLSVTLGMTLLTVGVNLVYTVVLIFLIAKMLSSEWIMFGK